jgi:uncharacterized protein with PIN domain
MKFIADAMLGKLAKRMRLLGLDVLYDPGLGDNEIIRLSLEQERVILTRDTGLAARPIASSHLFIKSGQVREQLEEVFAECHPEPKPLSRCSGCNTPISPVAKEDIQEFVPRHVYEKNTVFFHCPGCGRIYWRGSHVKRMAIQEKKPANNTGTGSPLSVDDHSKENDR